MMKTFIIAQTINDLLPPLWGEAKAFQKQNLYKIEGNKLPPVNYDSYTLNSHSLTHIEAESHVVDGGKTLDYYFDRPEFFMGPVVVVKLKGNHYRETEKGIRHWEVSRNELESALKEALRGHSFPGKILLTSEDYPISPYGYHDPNYVLTLSQEAADYLISFDNFNLYGTTWKSSDFKPGSPERPIHKTLFKKAVILECIDLRMVLPGLYQINTFPLRIEGASESPATPVLFQK